MRNSIVWVGFVALGVSSFAVGCSNNDPFGPTPDFGKVQSQFQAPTGSFAQGSEGSVLSGFGQQRTASASGFGVGGTASSAVSSTGGTTTKTIRFLDGQTAGGTASFCAALKSGADSGSCSCPAGGSLAYDLTGMRALQNYQGGPIDVTLKVRAEQCAVDGASVDGTEFVNLRSHATPSAQDLEMLIDLHVTATALGKTAHVDADFEYLNGKYWFSIDAGDGNVVVSGEDSWDGATNTGSVTVKDKNETWSCTLTAGSGTCTSDKGNTRQVKT